jgi:hypothetical protein
MNPHPSMLLTLAGVVVAAGCTSPTGRFDLPSGNPGWQDTGTPGKSVPAPKPYVTGTRHASVAAGPGLRRDDEVDIVTPDLIRGPAGSRPTPG